MKFRVLLLQNQPLVLINMEFLPVFDAPYSNKPPNNKPRAMLVTFACRGYNKQLVLLRKGQNDVLYHFTETRPYYLRDMLNTQYVLRSFASFASNLLTHHNYTPPIARQPTY